MELLPLVCLCLLSCSGDAVKVFVEDGSDAVLPCLISSKEDITGKLFDWRKVESQKEVFSYNAGSHHNNGRPGQDEQFKGRVSHFQDQLQNGDASIKITRTKMADSGNYSCDFPRLQPSQTFIIELVVGRVLRDRTGENIPGAAPEPNIRTLYETWLWSLLQCEAHGVPLPTLKWEDSDNNTLPAEEPQISERGGRFYITVNVTVTKTNRYRCVATQETLSHQVAAVTSVNIQAVRVLVKEGSDAVLPCLISTEEDITGQVFDWKKEGQKEMKEVFMYDSDIHYNNGRDGQDEQFKGRVSHFQDQLQNGNASIKIQNTKMADNGNYSCDFPGFELSQPSIIELVVDPVLKDRTRENIPGAAPEPIIRTLDDKLLWSVLQCEAHGVPRPTLKWEDSDNNTLPADTPQTSERGGHSYITVKITVTKNDNYHCVATQETLSHQIAAVTSVSSDGSNTGWIIAGVVSLLLVAVVISAGLFYYKNRIKQIHAEYKKKIYRRKTVQEAEFL